MGSPDAAQAAQARFTQQFPLIPSVKNVFAKAFGSIAAVRLLEHQLRHASAINEFSMMHRSPQSRRAFVHRARGCALSESLSGKRHRNGWTISVDLGRNSNEQRSGQDNLHPIRILHAEGRAIVFRPRPRHSLLDLFREKRHRKAVYKLDQFVPFDICCWRNWMQR
jgi:hypothetical protein